MQFNFNDGGRAAAGFKGKAGDCVTRAIAIGTGLPYKQVYDLVNTEAISERSKGKIGKRSSARTGVFKPTSKKILRDMGWTWTATMGIGTGCRVHLRADELPAGVLIVSLSRHWTTVVDGVVHDTYDPSRDGKRCVYGFWRKDA